MMKNNIRKIFDTIFPTYLHILNKSLKDCENLLDVGCGHSSPIKYINSNIRTVGLDAYEPNIDISRSKMIHNDYVLGNFDNLEEHFEDNSFDCVLANDVIEHLEKEDALVFLEKLIKIAKKKVIIFTPNGFLPQKAFDGNKWMEHKSGWEINEMKSLGFDVFGINGLNILRGQRCKIKYKPKIIWTIISYFTQLFTFRWTKYANQIFCVKEL